MKCKKQSYSPFYSAFVTDICLKEQCYFFLAGMRVVRKHIRKELNQSEKFMTIHE